jgi:anion-transporting  ArsA/GET3 family ATPase
VDAKPGSLEQLLAAHEIVISCGSGGVGKTTTAAAAAAMAAVRQGGKVLVLTVDPARRLANALGLEGLGNAATQVPADAFKEAGVTPRGQLWAAMLDTKQSWDDLVRRHAPDPLTVRRILDNPLYQNIAGRFVQSHEYIAVERLYELHGQGVFDLIVVDTPPTRNALDLLDAPRRLTRFLENRLFRALLVPTRMSLRAVSVATQALLRTISKVAGAEIVQDAVGFFQAFEGMEDGFRTRASAVHELLLDPATAYVLVTSARPDSVAEAGFFAEKLGERERKVAALVVNRLAPSFGDGEPGSDHDAVAPVGGSSDVPEALAALEANLAALNAVAAREATSFAGLAAQVAPAPVGRIPLFAQDVHEVGGLERAADQLFA